MKMEERFSNRLERLRNKQQVLGKGRQLKKRERFDLYILTMFETVRERKRHKARTGGEK